MNCKIESCAFNNGSGGCGFEKDDVKNSMFKELAEDSVTIGCKNKELKAALENIQNEKKPKNTQNTTPETTDTKCPYFKDLKKDGKNYYIQCEALPVNYPENHLSYENKTVATTHSTMCRTGEHDGRGLEWCRFYKEMKETIEQRKEGKAVTKASEISPVREFDYSVVDDDTAVFLQEKAQKITEIRIRSVVAIGKELKEAHERLASNKTGTFEAWVESLGISHKTSRNYINAYV